MSKKKKNNLKSQKSELKSLFTQYWDFLALQNACKIGLFDALADQTMSFSDLVGALYADAETLAHLLGVLVQLDTLKITKKRLYKLTKKGQILTEHHPESLRNACILWGQEHLNAWQHLDSTLRAGKPAFELLYGAKFFDYLADKPLVLENYHLAMRDYARDDYRDIAKVHDFKLHRRLVDVGGGLGALVERIAAKCPDTECLLFDLPEVANLAKYRQTSNNYSIIGGNFFDELPFEADGIILARILHDWPDEQAAQILSNCDKALDDGGYLYVCEIMNEEAKAHGLSLNMKLMCESHERSSTEYTNLLENAGFEIIDRKRLNDLQTLLICAKYDCMG